MANVIIDDTNLTNIANAIRGKNGTQNTYLPSQMATAITNIPSGGSDIPSFLSKGLVYGQQQHFSELYGYVYLPQISPSVYYETTFGTATTTHTRYYVSNSITTSAIGDDIVDYITSTIVSSGTNYICGPYFQNAQGYMLTNSSMNITYKYASVSLTSTPTGVPSDALKFVTTDFYGTITGVFNNANDLVTALNNKSVNINNGLHIFGSLYTAPSGISGKYQITFYGA